MYLDTTMQLAAIRHDELQRAARARVRPIDRSTGFRTRWGRRAARA
jgi:hypothetical protein